MVKENSYLTDAVAFAAHPDDAELSCGGLLAKLSRAGRSVGIVDLTRGELSSRGDLTTRALETERASTVLGLKLRENLALPDGGVSAESQEQLKLVVAAIRRTRPELLLVPYYDRHPDHGSACDLVTKAVFFASLVKFDDGQGGVRHLPRQVLYYQMRYAFEPSFVVDISDVHALKVEAGKCYASQLGLDSDIKPNQAPTLISSPLTLSSLEARDRYFGAMIGVNYAEGFKVRNVLKIDDPISHFRENSNSESLFFPLWK